MVHEELSRRSKPAFITGNKAKWAFYCVLQEAIYRVFTGIT